MEALDLFCGAGGASKGLLDAGFERVIGVDIEEQPEYLTPNDFRGWDVFEYLNYVNTDDKDFIWASPPCQAYSYGSKKDRNKGKKYPDLIAKTRKVLLKTGKPFVIENVVGAPLRKDLRLCGEMFGLRIIRHRVFETHSFECKQPTHPKHKLPITIKGLSKKKSWYMQVAGHGGQSYSFKLKDWQKAMGINWIKDRHTLAQCVPPAYAEYIGKEFLKNYRGREQT